VSGSHDGCGGISATPPPSSANRKVSTDVDELFGEVASFEMTRLLIKS